MLLQQVVATSAAVAATRSRKTKVAALAGLLGQVGAETPAPDQPAPDTGEIATLTSYLAGSLRQRRTGLGWRALQTLPEPAETSSLTIEEVDATFARIAALAGAGSQASRAEATRDLFARATAAEQHYLRGLVTGEIRQGALDSLVQEALAVAGDIPVAAVRRAAMMAGSTVAIAPAALTRGPHGGVVALDAFQLQVGRPVQPMLASSATSVEAAMAKAAGTSTGEAASSQPVAIDTKLDGIRIQVHRDGDDVLVVTRSLEDITARMPEVVAIVRALPAERVVLDGEVLALDVQGRPRPFQETASRTATRTRRESGPVTHLTPYFFDLLHLDGRDLVDAPGAERLAALEALVPAAHLVPRVITTDVAEAEAFTEQVLARGHEGVVVKSLESGYDAGRRGSAWVKVKPVHTLDLVVLAVEWGSGRRSGWLSNIHLGARDPEEPGRYVMLGKTFKGMTDEMLAWQTERFLGLATSRDGHTVVVRPEQVVEIAIDGLQRSTRYPGGLALRFARVVRYRDDKTAAEADTLATVRSLLD